MAVPRVGVHIPYTHKFMTNGGTPRSDMLNSTSFLATAAFYLREAICFSLPSGRCQLIASSAPEGRLFVTTAPVHGGPQTVHRIAVLR